jgi:hypothetical protein
MSAKAGRILALLRGPRHRSRLLDSLNKSTLDDVGPVGGEQKIKVLKELNEMQDLERDQVPGDRCWRKRKARTSLPGL